jgi:hypothetical protein
MAKEADRDRSIMREILKLNKKIDYLTDNVFILLNQISDKVGVDKENVAPPFINVPAPKADWTIKAKGQDNE